MNDEIDVKERAEQYAPEAVEFLKAVMAGLGGATVADRVRSAIAILEVAGMLNPYMEE